MKLLFINTATIEATVAIVLSGSVIRSRSWTGNRDDSEKLLPAIQSMISLEDISGIFVVKGPGPFTALRVGIVVANTLAQNLNLPLYAIDTFELLASAPMAASGFGVASSYGACDFVVLNGGGNTIVVKGFSGGVSAGSSGFVSGDGVFGEPAVYVIDDFIAQFGGKSLKVIYDLKDEQFEKLNGHFEMVKGLDRPAVEFGPGIGVEFAFDDIEKYRVKDFPLLPYYSKEPSITM